MGSLKQKTSSTQTATAYDPARPGIDSAVQGLTKWQNSPQARAVYGGQRTVGPSPVTQAGLGDYGNVGNARDASGYMRSLFMNANQPNPYMDQLLESVTASTRPGINSAFSQAGMSGSTQHQGVMARELGRATAPHLFGAHENQQNRAFQAAQLLPGMDERIGQRQIEAGQIREGYDRERVAADQAKFNEQKFAGLMPYAQTLPALSSVGSQFGTTKGTQTSKTSPSMGQQVLGGAMMAGSLFGGMPTGMGGLGAAASGFASGGMTGAQQGWAGMHNPAFWTPRGA